MIKVVSLCYVYFTTIFKKVIHAYLENNQGEWNLVVEHREKLLSGFPDMAQ